MVVCSFWQRVRVGVLGIGFAAAAFAAGAQDAKTTLALPPSPLLPQQVGEWNLQADTPAIPNDPKIDTILKEPPGGAQRDAADMIARTGDAIAQSFRDLASLDPLAIRTQRRQKFLDIGGRLG